ncbi:MAG: hypothetical protein SF187_22330 [Deltaproteobacteria bacterium]|nr:hypothetical protein [Deltaproteobacteria bacterium]
MGKLGPTHLVAFLAAVASCEPGTERIEPEAGAQLKPLYVTLGEERAFTGWFDKLLDDRCDFYLDGTRCVPHGVQLYFPDSACASVPIAIGCAELKVGFSQHQGLDGIFRLTPTIAAPELHYKTAETCQRLLGISPPLSSNLDPFALAATVPLAQLPERLSEDRVQLNDDIDLIVRSMSDGSRQPLTMFDRVRKRSCSPRWTSAGYRCIPHLAMPPLPFGEGTFLDDSCTVRALEYVWEETDLVASDDAGAQSPSEVASPFAERPVSVYRVERLADGPYSIFTRKNGLCEPLYSNQRTIHAPFALGRIIEKIDAWQFPEVARPRRDVLSDSTFMVGNKIISFTSSGASLLRRGVGACTIHKMGDGHHACLTVPSPPFVSFINADCTKAFTFGPALRPSTDRVVVKSDAASWCRATTSTLFGVSHHVTSAEHTVYFRDQLSGACVTDPVPVKAGTEYWQFDGEQALRPEDLVLDDETHEP